ncbi:MAG: chemotaxis protein MotA [Alphaproteobacteria bacterium]|nr:chemotaxis protein MotA [Alphaproteobacteria bacterium]
MIQIAGFFIVLAVVFGGLLISGGPAIMSALPFELALICGAAFGTLLIGNSPRTVGQALGGFAAAIRGARWQRDDYTNLLQTLHDLTSDLFAANPRLLRDDDATQMICDSFRLMALDPSAMAQADARLHDTVASLVEARQRAVSALHTLADALPALGIVAAVLGIIKTMGVIDQSPAILGAMIAAALLGTFLGVFLAYGLVGPIANRFGQVVEEEALYLDTIRTVLAGFAEGLAPRTAVELARSALPAELRPDIGALDNALMVTRLSSQKAA